MNAPGGQTMIGLTETASMESAGRPRVHDYITLIKPRIGAMVLVWAAAGAILTGVSDMSVFLWGIFGIFVASLSAAAINNWYDADIDSMMERTSARSVASGKIPRVNALLTGLALAGLSFGILLLKTNVLTAVLSLTTIAVYGCLYTMVLKRRTSLASEIGGLAGAMPPVLGWTAMTGSVGLEVLFLFGVMYFWQHPHFWAIASCHKEEYKLAGVPVLPVVATERHVAIRSLFHTVAMVIFSALPFFFGFAGKFYLLTAAILGIIFLWFVVSGFFFGWTKKVVVFLYSLIYITAFWIAYVADHFLAVSA